jgi:membrane fusion protein
MDSDPSPAPDGEPFLDPAPEAWAARSFATLLIGLALVALVGSALVRVPETVTAPFELVPVHGADPVRAPRAGVVREVRATEGATLAAGDTIFVLGSDLQSDRRSGLRGAESRRDGARDVVAHLDAERHSREKADAAEIERLERQLADLDKRIPLARDALRITLDVLSRYQDLLRKDLVSRTQVATHELEATSRRAELQELEGERAALGASLEALRNQRDAQASATAGTRRKLEDELREAEIEIEGLRGGIASGSEGDLALRAPCAGTLLSLAVGTPGGFVAEGHTLAEVACADRPLRARLAVPPSGVARLEPGLGVKLLYDAFPYERYGVRFATLEWVGPASVERAGARIFPALAQPDDAGVLVDGRLRPYRAGMGGRALIVVGRRSLLSMAFEPLRRLREAARDAPVRPASGH